MAVYIVRPPRGGEWIAQRTQGMDVHECTRHTVHAG